MRPVMGGDFDLVAVERFGVFTLERGSLDPAFSGCLPKLIYRDLRRYVLRNAPSNVVHSIQRVSMAKVPGSLLKVLLEPAVSSASPDHLAQFGRLCCRLLFSRPEHAHGGHSRISSRHTRSDKYPTQLRTASISLQMIHATVIVIDQCERLSGSCFPGGGRIRLA